jgi:hypothetical protein
VDWTNLPNGKIPDGKVLYLSAAGVFNDINILLVEDIFDENHKMAVVTGTSTSVNKNNSISSGYSLLSGTQEYAYNKALNAEVGSVARLDFSNGSLKSAAALVPRAEATVVDQLDAKRIMVNGSVFRFNNRLGVYFKGISGEVTAKGTNDIEIGKQYTKVSLYCDDSGKVEAIVIFE